MRPSSLSSSPSRCVYVRARVVCALRASCVRRVLCARAHECHVRSSPARVRRSRAQVPELYPTRPLMLPVVRCKDNDMQDLQVPRPEVPAWSWWVQDFKCTKMCCYCTDTFTAAGAIPLLRQCRMYTKSPDEMFSLYTECPKETNAENYIAHQALLGGRIPDGTCMEVHNIENSERCTAIQVRCHHPRLNVHPGLVWAILWIAEGSPCHDNAILLGSLSARTLHRECVPFAAEAALARRSVAIAAAPTPPPWVHCSAPCDALADAARLSN